MPLSAIRQLQPRQFSQRANNKRLLGHRPEPGHAYFCEETLALLQTMYPEMDLEPYRAALGDGTPRL